MRIPSRLSWLRRQQPGLALLESAMAFPLLLMVALAIMQLGLWGHEQTIVTGSVQEGARVAAAQDRKLTDGVTYAQSLLRAGIGRDAQGVTLTGTDLGDAVSIEAHGRMHLILPWI